MLYYLYHNNENQEGKGAKAMVKAVIFDLDGTLLNRDKSVENFITDQHERLSTFLGHINQHQYITRFIELEKHGYV